jgi:hypothetical protein
MRNRRDVLALMILGGMALGAPARAALAAGDCPPGAGSAAWESRSWIDMWRR